MKNILRRIISVMLALLMMSGCISAFAAEETIDWYWSSYGDKEDFMNSVPYIGELTAGKNTVGKDQDEDSFDDDGQQTCYRINLEADGYYLFTLSELDYIYNNYIYFSEDFIEGKAYGVVFDSYQQINEDSVNLIFNIQAGENAVLLQSIEQLELTYKYLGKEVTDVKFDEKYLEGIIGADFYTEDGYSYIPNLGGEIVFDSGEKFTFEESCSFNKGIVTGENTVEVEIMEFRKEVTLNVFEAKDFVTKLEPIGLEDGLCAKEYYNGYISADDIGEADIKITYADGRTETVDFDEGYVQITLPNGRSYWIVVEFERETLTANLYFANEIYESYELNVVPADVEDNLSYLHINNARWIEQANCDLRWRLDHLETAETLAEKISLVFWIPGLYTNALYQIFCNVVELIEFYI